MLHFSTQDLETTNEMSYRPDIPHPEIVWETNKPPFSQFRDNLKPRNIFTFRSAAVRGDEQAILQRLEVAGYYTPDSFDLKAEEYYLQRQIPTKDRRGDAGLNKDDPIFLEAQIPYFWSRCEPTPSRQKPVAYDGLDLTWIRDLGKGGFGVASLWEASFDDGHKMNIVIKRPVAEMHAERAFQDERSWHDRYRGAANITQSLDLAQIAKQHRTNPPKQRENSQGQYENKNTLVLEYMEHDNLGQMNHNLAYVKAKSWQGEKLWPNGALWQLFRCLVRGLAEMAYNKSLQEEHGTTLAEALTRMRSYSLVEQEWFWENLSRLRVRHDVHFDMEEYNILVGRDPDNGSIVFKFHDFSDVHSHKMELEWTRWNVGGYWEKRRPVKPGRHLPEQHSYEWDGLAATSMHPELAKTYAGTSFPPTRNRCAGRYGMWSNIFTIAKTMECCVTGKQYTHPFTAKFGLIEDEVGVESYGWRLYDEPQGFQPKNADNHLRHIITDCMQEDPASRPSLIQLLRAVHNAEECGLMEDDDQTCDFWWAATDPKEYCATGGQRPPLVAPDAPFSFESEGAESQYATAVEPAKPAGQRMDLEASSPYNPPQWLGPVQSAGRKRTADEDHEDERASKAQKSAQQSGEADDGGQQEQTVSGSGQESVQSAQVHSDPVQFRRFDALQRRGSPQLVWRDQTGLREALERQTMLSEPGN